jgi:hypothetical protein
VGVLGYVLRTAILWAASLVVAFAGMEASRRVVLAHERDSAAAVASRAATSASPTADLLCALPAKRACPAP